MHPVLIHIGPLVIRWYGVMIAIAFLVGIWLAGKEAQRKGIDREKLQDFFLYLLTRTSRNQKGWLGREYRISNT